MLPADHVDFPLSDIIYLTVFFGFALWIAILMVSDLVKTHLRVHRGL